MEQHGCGLKFLKFWDNINNATFIVFQSGVLSEHLKWLGKNITSKKWGCSCALICPSGSGAFGIAVREALENIWRKRQCTAHTAIRDAKAIH